jgi:hypothetical protein
LRFRFIILTLAALTIASSICRCSRDYNNPADPANNGGFYGGVDSVLAGTWDEIAPVTYLGALVCSDTEFVFKTFDYTKQVGTMHAAKGQIFCYFSNTTEPRYFFDYKVSAGGDTLWLNEETTAGYTDWATTANVPVLVRAQ